MRSKALALKVCDGRYEDVLTYAMFPQVAEKFFVARHEGPKNLGKDPAKAAAAPAAAPANGGKKTDSNSGPVLVPITYEVKVDGKAHKVTVAPA